MAERFRIVSPTDITEDLSRVQDAHPGNAPPETSRLRESRARPRWNRQERTLSYRGETIKQFIRDAEDQMLILDAFQEVGWFRRIDDPLPPRKGRQGREHLRKTVWNLNRLLPPGTIRFEIEPGGRGVKWVRQHLPRNDRRSSEKNG
jgi:hypothetical protein